MKRFDIGKDQWEMDFGELYEDDRGSLVKFSEADAEIRRLEKRIAELKAVLKDVVIPYIDPVDTDVLEPVVKVLEGGADFRTASEMKAENGWTGGADECPNCGSKNKQWRDCESPLDNIGSCTDKWHDIPDGGTDIAELGEIDWSTMGDAAGTVKEGGADECQWIEDSNGWTHTSCGVTPFKINPYPTEEQMCGHCRKPIRIIRGRRG